MAHGNRDRLGRTSFEADMSGNRLLIAEHRHILEQQTHHAFAISIRGAWIIPHTREIFD